MSRKLKGFSLAELLISLLIISIVLSAAIPTLTKKSAGSEQVWRWSNTNNSAYFGVGALQSAIIGSDVMPEITDIWGTMEGIETFADVKYTTSGDKLVLLKQSPSESVGTHMMNSHISFYTLANNSEASTNDVLYAGRLALERHNIALGIGALQSLNATGNDFLGNNTALGHFTLFRNKTGLYNTAVGEAALANNNYALHNTALGYQAGLSLDKNSTESNQDTNASYNTAIGSQALRISDKGRANTAVGFAALTTHTNGIGSTGVGSEALKKAYGTGNTALGSNACYSVETGSFNLCLGLYAGELLANSTPLTTAKNLNNAVKYGLFVGSFPNDGTSNSKISHTPLIFGRMQHIDANSPREVVLNTAKTEIRTFDGTYPMLQINTLAGSDGASNGGNYTGSLAFTTFYNGGGTGTGQSVLSVNGDVNGVQMSSNGNFTIGTTATGSANNITLSSPNVIVGNKQQINLNEAMATVNVNVNMQGNDIQLTSLGGSGNSLRKNIVDLWNAIYSLRASDARLKNISGDSKAGLKEINALEVKNYTYKNDANKIPHVGVIAQQLQKIFPNSVSKNNEGYLMIRTEEIFYAMVNAIKELYAKITGLDKRIVELEKENALLKKQNAEFEKRLEKLEQKIK